jgi:hypothetical protein
MTQADDPPEKNTGSRSDFLGREGSDKFGWKDALPKGQGETLCEQ